MNAARSDAGDRVEQLRALLESVTQGDIVSFGAVTIVGFGEARSAELDTEPDKLWSLTVDSDVGWYAIVSGPCEIDRSPATEPCITVAPIVLVSKERHRQLRSSGYSPREFPLSPDVVAKTINHDGDDFWPVVDLRFVTNVQKEALLNASVVVRRPLTGPQQRRFSLWVGRRFNRPAHSNQREEHVLSGAGRVVERLAAEFARADARPQSAPAAARLVVAATEWLVGGNDRLIDMHVVVDEASCKHVGYYSDKTKAIDEAQVGAAAKKLAAELRSVLVNGAGYAVKVTPVTLDGMTAAHYLALDPWLWDDAADPLSDDPSTTTAP